MMEKSNGLHRRHFMKMAALAYGTAVLAGWCVSLFMLPHRPAQDMGRDPIRFKNLSLNGEGRFMREVLRSAEVHELVNKVQGLLQDQGFYQRKSDGPFYIALSQNQSWLLEGTRHTVDEIEMEAMAQSVFEAFPEVSTEKQLQFHTGTPSGTGGRAAMLHGHDVNNENKDRILSWVRMIDRALRNLLPDGPAPLALTGVDSLFPIYREANTYPHLMEWGIAGNPERLKPESLHGQAWALVEPVFKKGRDESAARYRQLAGTGQMTTDVKKTVLADCQGRMDGLFVAGDEQLWGRFDYENDRVYVRDSPEPGDEDLLDLVAIQSQLKGGTVYAVLPDKVPDQARLVAVLRY